MAGEQNISKPVNFEQIPVDIVPPEPSDRKVPVVLDVGDLLGIAEVYQPCLRQLEAKILILKARQVRRDSGNNFWPDQPPRLYTQPGCSPCRTHRT